MVHVCLFSTQRQSFVSPGQIFFLPVPPLSSPHPVPFSFSLVLYLLPLSSSPCPLFIWGKSISFVLSTWSEHLVLGCLVLTLVLQILKKTEYVAWQCFPLATRTNYHRLAGSLWTLETGYLMKTLGLSNKDPLSNLQTAIFSLHLKEKREVGEEGKRKGREFMSHTAERAAV